jgi:putative transposase
LHLTEAHQISERKACRLLKLSRTVFHYQHRKPEKDDEVIEELNKLAGRHPGYGFWKMYQRLRLDGRTWNHKRIYRVYTQMKLNIRRKHKRRLPARQAIPASVPKLQNEMWSMDFMHDALYNGRKVKVLNVIEEFNRQALAMVVDTSIASKRVLEVLDRLIEKHGKPLCIRTDNGPEFISHIFLDWCHKRRIQHQFIQPGKPTQNCFIERFNGSFRKEILDAYVFYSLNELRIVTENWMNEYNNYRPHDSLQGLTPELFSLKYGKLSTLNSSAEFTTFQQKLNNKNDLIKFEHRY